MSWLRDHEHYLKRRRRPPGDEHLRARPNVWYRTPLSEKSHLAVRGETALCGRALDIDPMWWVDSGWEGVLGDWYLIPEQRATGRCGPCKTALDSWVDEPVRPSPFGEDTQAQAEQYGAQVRMRRRNHLALIRALGFPDAELVDE